MEQVLHENIDVADIKLSTNSYMYDQNGELISEIYRDANRMYLPFDKIPTIVIDAFVSTEDRRFFDHKGYDPSAMLRAFLVNLKKESIEEGASTVTQQLVRNLYLTNEQTYDRKINEVLYAYKLEQLYSKEEIIELYLNTIFFQNGIYGFEAASQYYFSVPSTDLTLAQVAFLSAIPNNPSHYNPLTNKENTILRQQWILEKMLENNVISAEEYEQARKEPIALTISNKVDKYPDYVTYVLHELTELVSISEGYSRQMQLATTEGKDAIMQQVTARVNELLESGITIETHLDPKKQTQAIQAIQKHVPYSDIQGSSVIIHHPTNAIVALTGGKGYKKFDFHRGFQAYRQPGSAIKPLLVYGPYIAEYDIPLQSPINANHFCKNGYCPKNFGGAQYGNVSIETAFKHSYNTPAVRLLDRLGVNTAFSYLEKFDFSQIKDEDYRLPSALGGFTRGMSNVEMTNAYTVFANDGVFERAYSIKRVKDRNGSVLYEWKNQAIEVWDFHTNEKMKKLLNKVVTEGTGRRANIASNYIGGKTGTTNDIHDIWFIGTRNEYTAGVWIGKDKPASLETIYNQGPHLLVWRELVQD